MSKFIKIPTYVINVIELEEVEENNALLESLGIEIKEDQDTIQPTIEFIFINAVNIAYYYKSQSRRTGKFVTVVGVENREFDTPLSVEEVSKLIQE